MTKRRLLAAVISNRLLGQPVAELEIFSDFSPLVTILERLFGMMFSFTERMFGIANCFAHDCECFHHSFYLLFTGLKLTA